MPTLDLNNSSGSVVGVFVCAGSGHVSDEIDPNLVSVNSIIPNDGEVVICRCRLDGGKSFQLWPARYVCGSWLCVFTLRKLNDVTHWRPFPIPGEL